MLINNYIFIYINFIRNPIAQEKSHLQGMGTPQYLLEE